MPAPSSPVMPNPGVPQLDPSLQPKVPSPEAMAAAQELYPPDYAANFRRTVHTLLERAWIIILCLILCVAAGAAYIHHAQVLYSSTATIQVEKDQPQVFRYDPMQARDVQAVDYMQTVVQSLKARPLLEGVAALNSLSNRQDFIVSKPPPYSDYDIARELDKIVSAKLRRGTRLIDISVTHSSPELTKSIANAIVDKFTSQNSERHITTASSANTALDNEAKRLREKLQLSEKALQDYKQTNNAASLDEQQNTVVASLKELSTKVNEAKSTRIKAESDSQQVQRLGANIEALLTLPRVATDPAVVAAKQNLSKAESDFAALRQRYKEKHPKYIQAVTQIGSLLEDMNNAVLQSARSIEASLEAAKASEDALQSALDAQQEIANTLSKLSVGYSVLSREVEADRTMLDSVLKSMKESGVTKEINPLQVNIVQPAYVPQKPVAPKKAMILALSSMGGLFMGILIVLALGFVDTSIKTVDEAESLLRLPVLCTVPQMSEVKKNHSPLVVLDQARSAGAESFRTLRTSLSMLGRVEDRRVFLFTSSLPSEGKTFSSINYSASLAQLGLKTLLIDGDLRRPNVENTLMGPDKDTKGVTDYLTGQKTLAEVVQPTKLENLWFISGGTTAPNPAELLARDGLGTLIQEGLSKYDRVVVDSAPIHAVSDTLLMLKNVQTLVLVVAAARTSSRSVLRCIQLLQGAAAPLSGILLNRMPRRRGVGYYQYGSYYDYNYYGKYSKKGVYGSDKK